MDDTAALVRRAQAGDEVAFTQLIEVHYETIFRFAYRWCADRTDAEDIAQLCCIKLARTLAQYRHQSAFTSWLYRLVINCAKDWRRAQARHHRGETHAADDAGRADSAEESVYLTQLLARLDTMPDGWKEAVLLVHAQGMTHAEAAACLQVSENTVSWRIHQARKSLNEFIQQEGHTA